MPVHFRGVPKLNPDSGQSTLESAARTRRSTSLRFGPAGFFRAGTDEMRNEFDGTVGLVDHRACDGSERERKPHPEPAKDQEIGLL